MSKPSVQRPNPNSTDSARPIQIFAWTLSLIVSVIAIMAWGRDYGWRLVPVNNYQLFPLLGLLAFSIMWSHYVSGAAQALLHAPKGSLKRYYQFTGYVVLALICLHPGLLIYQRFRDGYGLPPHSYESYVQPSLGWVTLLGSVSLLIFLAYELHRFFSDKPWWHYVQEAGDFAMLAILYHGFRLGGQFQHGWFRDVWGVYAVILVTILARSYYRKYSAKLSHVQ